MKPRHRAQARLTRRIPSNLVRTSSEIEDRIRVRSELDERDRQCVGERVAIRERQFVRLAKPRQLSEYCPQVKRLIRTPYAHDCAEPTRTQQPARQVESRPVAGTVRLSRDAVMTGSPLDDISLGPDHRMAPFYRRRLAVEEDASWT